MSGRNVVVGILTVACFAGAAYFFLKNTQPVAAEDDRPILLMCVDRTCGNVFERRPSEAAAFAAANPGAPMLGPKCNKGGVVPAFACPSCKAVLKSVGHGEIPKNCPSCKAEIDPATVRGPMSEG